MGDQLAVETQTQPARAKWWRFAVKFAWLIWPAAALANAVEAPSRLPVVRAWGVCGFLGGLFLCAAAAPMAWSRRWPVPPVAGVADPRAIANRKSAFQTGYWAVLCAAAALYAVSIFTPLRANVVLLLLLTVAHVVPTVRMIVLERRAGELA